MIEANNKLTNQKLEKTTGWNMIKFRQLKLLLQKTKHLEVKLKDTGFYIRDVYSKETISIRKKLWEDMKNLCKKVHMNGKIW